MTRPLSMLKKWIAPLHVCDFTEKLLHYLGSGARLFKACEAIKLCLRRYRRWRKSTADNRGGYRARNQALSEAEKTEIVERFTSDGMGDLPVNIAHAKLMDSGVYLASASSCVRVMNEYYRSEEHTSELQ